jgi:hypothetical protein
MFIPEKNIRYTLKKEDVHNLIIIDSNLGKVFVGENDKYSASYYYSLVLKNITDKI